MEFLALMARQDAIAKKITDAEQIASNTLYVPGKPEKMPINMKIEPPPAPLIIDLSPPAVNHTVYRDEAPRESVSESSTTSNDASPTQMYNPPTINYSNAYTPENWGTRLSGTQLSGTQLSPVTFGQDNTPSGIAARAAQNAPQHESNTHTARNNFWSYY